MSNYYRYLIRSAKYPSRRSSRSSRKSTDDLLISMGFVLVLGVVLFGWQVFHFRPVFFSVIAILIITVFIWRKWSIAIQRHAKIRAIQISQIDTMDGLTFEHYVGKLLQFQGFKIQVTPARGDYGVDIIASRGKIRCAVQCKRYQGSVSRTAISDVVAGASYYKCNASMVVTNAYYTKGAKTLALANHCQLIDRNLLITWIVAWQKA